MDRRSIIVAYACIGLLTFVFQVPFRFGAMCGNGGVFLQFGEGRRLVRRMAGLLVRA
jgi:hypothetical protein